MNAHDMDDDVARVMARNAEILECKRQNRTERLAQLEAARRREVLLASFDLDPDGTWSKLTEEEKQDRDLVIKGISNGVFGINPWYRRRDKRPLLPEQFREDRDVVLASVRREFAVDCYITFQVPESLRDDKEVMLAVCTKDSRALKLASPRLQDDCDVVLAALNGDKYDDQCQLEHASNRLRSDKDFILNQVECTNIHIEKWRRFEWLKYAQLRLEDEKQVALAVLKRTSELKSSGRSWESFVILEHFSPALRNDRDVMLRYVEDNWSNLDDCSNRLKSFEEFINTAVSQNIDALRYCLEATKEDFFSKRDKNDVLQELEDGDLSFESLPKVMKTDPRVLLAALKGGSVHFKDLPKDLRSKKEFILSLPEGHPDNEEPIYDAVPEHLQEDEEICLEIIKKKYDWFDHIFREVPSLYNSREAILAAIEAGVIWELPEFLKKGQLLDDEEVMLLACEKDNDCLRYASERLKSEHGFIQTVLHRSRYEGILGLPHDFQVNNTDLVVEAIERCSDNDDCAPTETRDCLAPDLWEDRSIVLACLKKGWLVLGELDIESPLGDDAELFQLAVENCDVSELEFANSSLKSDRDFVLSVVKINGLSLSYVDARFKRDDEIVTEAIANTGNTILDCFHSEDDFGYLVSFASRVRSPLELHKSFVNDFLSGISVSRPHVAPARRCRLPILDRGSETSTAFKKLIAEYLGVPMKTELRLLRTASENLRKLRY